MIIVFCTMIGVLILEPGSKEQQAKKRRMEIRRRNEVRRIASESFMV